MSFPAYNDADEVTSSSGWTNIESDETRRLHDSIVAAAELLKRDSVGVAAEYAIPEQRFDGDVELTGIPQGCFELEAAPSHQWLPELQRSTTPQLVEIDEWFSLGAMLKLGAVAGLAVGVAFTTLNTVPTGVTTALQDTRSPIFSLAALSGLAQIGAAQAKVQSTTSVSVPVVSPPSVLASASAVLAAAQANVDLATASLAPSAAPTPATTTLAPLAALSRGSEMSPPTVVAIPPPRSHTAAALGREEVAALMKRGRILLAAGDIPSARLILTRIAENGEAEASLLLAATFDPAELARLHVIGAEPDVAQARTWYARAAEQGSPEGSRRLQRLVLR
jgi:hypothetical protein